MSSDPLRLVWDRLEAAGCRPHGKSYDFRARCPGHDGENREALHVAVGADGRAVVHCFAHGCDVDTIAGALGLNVRDLFPPGHHRAPRRQARPVRRSDFEGAARKAANVLYALEQVGEPWRLMIASDCPYCHSQGAWLLADSDGRVSVDCPTGCHDDKYVQALLGRLHDREEAR